MMCLFSHFCQLLLNTNISEVHIAIYRKILYTYNKKKYVEHKGCLNNMYKKIIQLTEDITPELVRQRRDFHKYPETRWTEMRTASIIAGKLTELGYEVLIGEQVCNGEARGNLPSDEALEQEYQRAIAQGADPKFAEATKGGLTGVIGILRCGEGPTVAIRFDIDALKIDESQDPDHFPVQEGFASVNSGVMHSCGHDGHAASGLGVAQVLAQIKDQLHGTVKLIFQPGEEAGHGAKTIVDKGHLDDVDFLFGAHNSMGIGDVDVTPGICGSLATRRYNVMFKGLSAHAGLSPQNGNNALLAAATAVQNLYAIPRHGKGMTRINVGKFISGTSSNVIADEAYMEIEMRGENTELIEYMDHHSCRILKSAAQMHGCTLNLNLMAYAPSLTCDLPFAEKIDRICKQYLNLKTTESPAMKIYGSDDVAHMIDRVRSHGGMATFMRIHNEQTTGNHNGRYNLDEEYMSRCAKIFCITAYELMK